ncbi:MAG: hypothetical protein F2590_03870 [Actinobacteria bacterium]|uniref:Unannotated protein n=1 Tax=freshwater metagenome TaxID=449393 RepID=A0A6J6HRI8_9ZZZZ|nr:hypothetical protein [Actinomycetota bacterium]
MLERDIALLVALVAAAFTLIGYPLSRRFTSGGDVERRNRATAWAMLASGVAMILVAAVELVPSAIFSGFSTLEAVAWLLAGLLGYIIFDKVVDKFASSEARFKRSALTVAIALTLHNLPEGAAIVASEFAGVESAVATAASLALHNIPEGVAIALVALAAGFKPSMSALLVLVSALAEASGAFAFWAFNFEPDQRTTSIVVLVVAALMLAISLVELLPRAFRTLARDEMQTFNK